MRNTFDEIARLVPLYSNELLNLDTQYKNLATDIKFTIGSSPIILMGERKYILKNCPVLRKIEMEELVFLLCDNSVYKHMNEIKQGFITVKNRFRAGICGTAVISGQDIENISDITSVIIRVPRYILGSADEIRSMINGFSNGVLIVGEPSSGKTTALRDIINIVSNKRLVVLDERNELCGGYKSCDYEILCGYPKVKGINHAVRNLGATHIICDEIDEDDLPALISACSCGVSIIGTIHGDLSSGIRPIIKKLLEYGVFNQVVELQKRDKPCRVRKVWERDELLKNYRCNNALYVG